MNRVLGFGDETNDAPLEGREDRRRPLVVECDPADRGSVLAKRPELDGLDLESLCLLLAERDGVRIGARTLVPLCRCRRLRPCDAIGPEPGKRGRLPLTARPSTRQITIPTPQIMPMRLGRLSCAPACDCRADDRAARTNRSHQLLLPFRIPPRLPCSAIRR